jgi:hypothetical protein
VTDALTAYGGLYDDSSSYGTSYLDAFEVNADAPMVTTYDDRDSRLRYFGSWTTGSFPQAYAGTLKWSRNTTDGVSFTFTRSYLNYVFTKAYNRGYATVVIDGVGGPHD